VCKVLGLNNTTEALRGLDDDEKDKVIIDHVNRGRGNPYRYIINEPGLYSLILRSRKPQAKAFKRNPPDSGKGNPSMDHESYIG